MSTKQCRHPRSGSPKDLTNYLKSVQISFHLDWLIDRVLFNRPIMGHTQVLVHRWGPEQGFRHCFADGLDHSLVSSAAQVSIE